MGQLQKVFCATTNKLKMIRNIHIAIFVLLSFLSWPVPGAYGFKNKAPPPAAEPYKVSYPLPGGNMGETLLPADTFFETKGLARLPYPTAGILKLIPMYHMQLYLLHLLHLIPMHHMQLYLLHLLQVIFLIFKHHV